MKGFKSLTVAAERENLFMKTTDVDNSIHTNFEGLKHDPISNAIIAVYVPTTKTALCSTGDGDCLFNSFSIHQLGNESKSIELRYRCTIEMVINQERILKHPMYPALLMCSPDYEDACLECSQIGKSTSVFCMMALSNLLNVNVESVYPAVGSMIMPLCLCTQLWAI